MPSLKSSKEKQKEQLKLFTIPLNKIKPWPGNPRQNHPVDQIAKSIDSFGYINPIIIQKGTNRILAGHGRYEALKKLNAKEAHVLEVDLDDEKANLYTLADNKLAQLAEWDFSKMADMLLEFDEKNIDMTITGFDEKEIKQVMNWVPKEVEMPLLSDIENPEFQQMTFILSSNQAEIVKTAIEKAIKSSQVSSEENKNKNGNALALIANLYLYGKS